MLDALVLTECGAFLEEVGETFEVLDQNWNGLLMERSHFHGGLLESGSMNYGDEMRGWENTYS